MGKAARAIIIEDKKMLLMHRSKVANEYFTLVGGRITENETIEQGLAREVMEETGLSITKARLVFFEEHPEPYNQQYIFLCEVAPHDSVAIQTASEEGLMNTVGLNIHTPIWVFTNTFHHIRFRTPQLQSAITVALKKGFPEQPVKL